MPEIIHPESEAAWLEMRRADVTSTESAALFGLSPYVTEFELYHRKIADHAPEFADNERTRWGRRLERVIAEHAAEERGYNIRALNAYMRHSAIPRMGASFDFEIVGNRQGPGILECKNVDWLRFRDAWAVDAETGALEAPTHIEIQIQHQLAVSGRAWAEIAVHVGGNDLKILHRQRDPEMIGMIERRVAAFAQRIEDGDAPPPVFPGDADFVIDMYARAGAPPLDRRADPALNALAHRYAELGAEIKTRERERAGIKAQILMSVGDADKIRLADGWSITAATVGEREFSFTRRAFRAFRVNQPKGRKS